MPEAELWESHFMTRNCPSIRESFYADIPSDIETVNIKNDFSQLELDQLMEILSKTSIKQMVIVGCEHNVRLGSLASLKCVKLFNVEPSKCIVIIDQLPTSVVKLAIFGKHPQPTPYPGLEQAMIRIRDQLVWFEVDLMPCLWIDWIWMMPRLRALHDIGIGRPMILYATVVRLRKICVLFHCLPADIGFLATTFLSQHIK